MGVWKFFFFNVYTTCPIYDFKHVKMYYNNFSGTKIWLGRSEQFIKFSNYFFFFPCVLAECFYINKITKILWKNFFCSSFSFCTVLLFLISLPKLPWKDAELSNKYATSSLIPLILTFCHHLKPSSFHFTNPRQKMKNQGLDLY